MVIFAPVCTGHKVMSCYALFNSKCSSTLVGRIRNVGLVYYDEIIAKEYLYALSVSAGGVGLGTQQ